MKAPSYPGQVAVSQASSGFDVASFLLFPDAYLLCKCLEGAAKLVAHVHRPFHHILAECPLLGLGRQPDGFVVRPDTPLPSRHQLVALRPSPSILTFCSVAL